MLLPLDLFVLCWLAVLSAATRLTLLSAARVDRRANRSAAGRVGRAFAFRVAQADADADAGLLDGIDRGRHLADRRGSVDRRQRGQARVARVLGRLGHACHSAHRLKQRRAHRTADGGLAVAGMVAAPGSVLRRSDQHVRSADGDIAALRQHVARRLRVGVAGRERDVAVQAGELAARLRDGLARAILLVLDGADR
jgi:hypothetical protein